jgi:hypothetical protein
MIHESIGGGSGIPSATRDRAWRLSRLDISMLVSRASCRCGTGPTVNVATGRRPFEKVDNFSDACLDGRPRTFVTRISGRRSVLVMATPVASSVGILALIDVTRRTSSLRLLEPGMTHAAVAGVEARRQDSRRMKQRQTRTQRRRGSRAEWAAAVQARESEWRRRQDKIPYDQLGWTCGQRL